jgi:hypothetical protein
MILQSDADNAWDQLIAGSRGDPGIANILAESIELDFSKEATACLIALYLLNKEKIEGANNLEGADGRLAYPPLRRY